MKKISDQPTAASKPEEQSSGPVKQSKGQSCETGKSGGMMAGMCFNWKVVAALAAVGVGIWVLAPGVAIAAAPLLLLAACPLSMLLMMKAMGGMGGRTEQREDDRSNQALVRRTGKPGHGTGEASLPVSSEASLADLKAGLSALQEQQEMLADRIARREAAAVGSGTQGPDSASRDKGNRAMPARGETP